MLTWIKKHYHWIIAGIVLLEMSIYVGFLNNLASLHLVPVTQDLNVSRSSVSLAFSAKNLVGFFATMTSGAMFMKHGYRKLLLWGMLLGSGAYFLMAASQSVWLLAAACDRCDPRHIKLQK